MGGRNKSGHDGVWRVGPLDAGLVADSVVPGACYRERDAEQRTAGEGVVGEGGEEVEAGGGAGDGFGENAAEEVGGGHTVTAVAVGVEGGGGEAAHLRESREGEGEIAAPGVVDSDVF